MDAKFLILISLIALLCVKGFDGSPVKEEDGEVDFVQKVHVVFMNHLDAGYALPLKIAYLVNVMHVYWHQYFPKAAHMAEKLRNENTGETFIYTTHPWLLLTFFRCPQDFVTAGVQLECPDDAAQSRIREAITRGDISWHAGPMNMQHEFANQFVYRMGLNISQELDDMFNITRTTRVLRNTDVPAVTQAIIPHLVDAGIMGVSVGTNGGAAVIDIPKGVFRWQYPGTGQEVLATWHFGGYPNRPGTVDQPGGLSRKDCVVLEDLQFPEALCFAFKGDNNGPPASVGLIRQWYRIIASQFPDAEIFASTLGNFFAAVEQIRDQLPVSTKEMGDPWIDGVASDPRKTAEYRAVNRALETCFIEEQCDMMDARIQAGGPYLVKMYEHTWGVHRLSDIPPRLGDAYQISVNSWLEQREMLNFTLDRLGDHPVVEAINQQLTEVHSPLDLTGYEEVTDRQFYCGENQDVTIGFSEAGHVNLLNHKGVIWASGQNSIGEIMYQTSGPPNSSVSCSFNSTSFTRKHIHPTPQKQAKNDKVFWPTTLNRVLQRDVARCEFISEVKFVNEEAHTTYGAPSSIYLSYKLSEPSANQEGLHVDVHWMDKKCTLTQEATFVKFNFSGETGGSERSDWVLDKLGHTIDPYNVAANGSAFIHSIDTGVGYSKDGHSLWLETLDSPLFSWVTENQGPFAGHNVRNQLNESISAVAFNLHNNDWTTNYIYWYPYLEEDQMYKARFFIKFLD